MADRSDKTAGTVTRSASSRPELAPRMSSCRSSEAAHTVAGWSAGVRWFLPINGGLAMTNLDSMTQRVQAFEEQAPLDQAQLAAAAYLARYSGRTPNAYRHDLRTFFQWAADIGLAVLDDTRSHI